MTSTEAAIPLQVSIFLFLSTPCLVTAMGSMSSIAVSYGENGAVFCGLSPEGSHQVLCYGADASVVYGAPSRLSFSGLAAGDGFVCGLLLETSQPYCWGNNGHVNMGVPQRMVEGATYAEISAGDNHLCALRKPLKGPLANTSLVDCWGYNMTASHTFQGRIASLTAGSVFNCGLLSSNHTASCWGDETGSRIVTLLPRSTRFRSISAGGYHVCGVLEDDDRVSCWGRSLSMAVDKQLQEGGGGGGGDVDQPPPDRMLAVVGGRFHACGIRSVDRGVRCWGFHPSNSVPPPAGARVYAIAAGDYFTCAVSAAGSLRPLCWGTGFPTSIPMAVSPGICILNPCGPGFYELATVDKVELCRSPNSRVCLRCSDGCPAGTYQTAPCGPRSDRQCNYDCSIPCDAQPECTAYCSAREAATKTRKFSGIQIAIFAAELAFAVVLVASVSLVSCAYVRYRLRRCECSGGGKIESERGGGIAGGEAARVRPDLEELKIQRARVFSYEELERATDGFSEQSQVGKGSFSCVYKGVLKDGTVVAVKRAIVASPDVKRHSKEFHTELDLLSRLNHAHLLSLLGYCEEHGEMLLVYEFMAHGSLHQHLHGKDPRPRERLDWVRRVTIAVQAARGIEYLHGYACPPVIHRDIKSSNILIDEEHNARVSDFGLSLLGPADSGNPLSEPPAGTFGYLDPEYYRLHYLTTKSDVYSFGVLLLEILSGRKAIDMQLEEGRSNIVEWAVPLIKGGDVTAILDPVLRPPPDLEALRRIANVASRCVRMRGKERPSMDKVTTALERALALLMGSPCNDQPILPTEVVLGSSRLHKKASQRSSNRSYDAAELEVDQRIEFRAPSWITFPSVASSQRRKSDVSDGEGDGKFSEGGGGGRNANASAAGNGDGLRCLEEEIGPASPHENMFLQHNF